MTTNIIPGIGVKGTWTASAPYSEALIATSVYECVGVRRLSDIIAAGEDGFAKYYQPYGAVLSDFVRDVQSGICIVSLVAGNGQWRYIPSNKLTAAPSMAGVKYSRIVVGIELGELPDSMDLTPLTDTIQLAVHHFLAIEVPVQLMVTSATILKTQEEHDARLATIGAMRDLNKNDYTRNVELTAEVLSLRNKLLIAERYILDHR